MKTRLINRLVTVAMLGAMASLVQAKLPAPTEEEAAKLAAAKAKAAADAEIEKQLLAKAQDRVVARYAESKAAKAQGDAVPGASRETAASIGTTQEVPSAALNSRTTEKAGAYNEAVTPQSAGRAVATGSQPDSADVRQNQQVVPPPEKK